MRKTAWMGLAAIALVLTTAPPLSVRGGVFDHLWPNSGPPTLSDVARAIDCIQEALVNQGTVSVKQPDIWSQGRMTSFRKEFEDQLQNEIRSFEPRIAARIARSDAASFSSTTTLGASLTPGAAGSEAAKLQFTKASEVATEAQAAATLAAATTSQAPGFIAANQLQTNFALLKAIAPAGFTADGQPQASDLKFGLEPNVFVDQKADYISHVQRIRRINLGDDNSDSAGYGLYLMRIPVSIQPGDKTNKGFGAIVNLTIAHDFGPRYLQSTYRSLVINDLVDQLSPVIHELIRNGSVLRTNAQIVSYVDQGVFNDSSIPLEVEKTIESYGAKLYSADEVQKRVDSIPADKKQVLEKFKSTNSDAAVKKSQPSVSPISRISTRTFAVAPSDVGRVFIPENLLNLATAAQQALDLVQIGENPAPDLNSVRMTEVRSFLRQELQSSYDLLEGRGQDEPAILGDLEYIESLTNLVYSRKYEGSKSIDPDSVTELNMLETHYDNFTSRLPGNLYDRPIGALAWAIAVQSGLLNRQLHEDMKQTKGPDGWVAPPDVDSMAFYAPEVPVEVESAFQEYVRARWPMITFALEPNVDQQNIEDSFTLRRDLQLAISFALASGRISFRQANNFQRQLQYEAQAIALNQTVAAFANGNDTFGWRMSPRFQTPPTESNMRAVANLLLNGGPGPNWGLKNSKIEGGMREMTAVVVMPSFVRGMRLDVSSDWYRLADPDERKVHTARAVELGRRINEARDNIDLACQHAKYRPEDVNRLKAKLHQLETMLPLQTAFVKVPYENTLGGMALFTPGSDALVPELNGFEGVEYADIVNGCDVLVYGKHFSQYESALLIGGKNIPKAGTEVVIRDSSDPTGTKDLKFINSLNPPRDDKGRILLVNASNNLVTTASPIKDPGVYDILSREIIRVRIPSDVKTVTRADGTRHIELFLSTPNGISNKLQIPLMPPAKPATEPSFSEFSENPGLAFENTDLKLRYVYDPATKQYQAQNFLPGASLRIVPVSAAPNLISGDKATIRFVFELSDTNKVVNPIVISDVEYDPETRGFKLKSAQLNELSKQIFAMLKPAAITLTPDLAFKTIRVEVQLPPPAAGLPMTKIPPLIPTANQLSVRFEIILKTTGLPMKEESGGVEVDLRSGAEGRRQGDRSDDAASRRRG